MRLGYRERWHGTKVNIGSAPIGTLHSNATKSRVASWGMMDHVTYTVLRRMRHWSLCGPAETHYYYGPAWMDGLNELATPSGGWHRWHSKLLRRHCCPWAARPFGSAAGRMELLVDGPRSDPEPLELYSYTTPQGTGRCSSLVPGTLS